MKKSTGTRLACAAVFGGASLASQATTVDLGAIGIGAPKLFDGAVLSAGPFIDVFMFVLPENGGSGFSAANFPLAFPGGAFNTLLTGMSLFANPDGIPFNADDDVLKTAVPGAGGDLSLTWGATSGGSMYLSVSGIANGTSGGLYTGAIGVNPVPIPEPEIWAMMIVGAGLVGFRLRHRSRKAAANRFF